MFTGIIEATGTLRSSADVDGDRRLTLQVPAAIGQGLRAGDSVAVNGVCLTAIEPAVDGFSADVSLETLGATTAGGWQTGQRLNLEPALTLDRRLGGHLVSGHVDGVAELLGREPDARSQRLDFSLPAPLARYVARKGSITIDGVSLTVNDVGSDRFGVNIVPHTLSATTLGELTPGDRVNLEVDLVARYLERLLNAEESPQ